MYIYVERKSKGKATPHHLPVQGERKEKETLAVKHSRAYRQDRKGELLPYLTFPYLGR
jgi:hypothetical protein